MKQLNFQQILQAADAVAERCLWYAGNHTGARQASRPRDMNEIADILEFNLGRHGGRGCVPNLERKVWSVGLLRVATRCYQIMTAFCLRQARLALCCHFMQR